MFTQAYFTDALRRGAFTALAVATAALLSLRQLGGTVELNRHTATAVGLAAVAGLISVLVHAVLDPILKGQIKTLFGGIFGMMLLTIAQTYGAQLLLQLDSASPFDPAQWRAIAVSVGAGALTLILAALRQASTSGPAEGLPITGAAFVADPVPVEPAQDGDDSVHAATS
jgi:hypothetical protein